MESAKVKMALFFNDTSFMVTACVGEREGDELVELHRAGQCKPGQRTAGETSQLL